jgi:hypothetical protein
VNLALCQPPAAGAVLPVLPCRRKDFIAGPPDYHNVSLHVEEIPSSMRT